MSGPCVSFTRPVVVCGCSVYGSDNAVVVQHGMGASESGSEFLTGQRARELPAGSFLSVRSHQWHSDPSLSSPGQTKASHSSAVLWPGPSTVSLCHSQTHTHTHTASQLWIATGNLPRDRLGCRSSLEELII